MLPSSCAQVGLTAFNMLCWALPLKNRAFSENKALLSYANAFAGGIFLMLSFGHLLPESMAGMAKNSAERGTKTLVYCLAGYMAMLFIEKVAFATHEEPPEAGPVGGPSLSGPNSAPCHVETSNRQKSAIALCCAMSVHSFFEAAALGLATDFTSAYMMSACIALHQPAESVALLVAFLKAEMPTRRTVLWLTGFSVVSIAGVLAGLLVNRLASSRVEAIVMAITAGTFIYVGATEVILNLVRFVFSPCCPLLPSVADKGDNRITFSELMEKKKNIYRSMFLFFCLLQSYFLHPSPCPFISSSSRFRFLTTTLLTFHRLLTRSSRRL